jgi:hypothetical protein
MDAARPSAASVGRIACRRAEEEGAEGALPFASDDEVGGFHARLREQLTCGTWCARLSLRV